GVTNSFDFPVHDGAQSKLTGLQDGFVAKVLPDGTGTAWATYFGGRGTTNLSALAVEAGGNLMLAGGSDAPDLPLSHGSRGREDGFFARLDAAGKILETTYADAPGAARLYATGSTPDGQAYVAGSVSLGTDDVLAAKVAGSSLASLSRSGSVHQNAAVAP